LFYFFTSNFFGHGVLGCWGSCGCNCWFGWNDAGQLIDCDFLYELCHTDFLQFDLITLR
jgi:hypothetical protein